MIELKAPGSAVRLVSVASHVTDLARRLRAKFWPDCAIPDTSMKFGTVVDHD